MSEALDRFRESMDSTERQWVDDYDLDALGALPPDELAQAEQLLIRRLDAADARAPRALVAVGSSQAVPLLRARLEGSHGAMRVEVALALWRLAQFGAAADAIGAVLHDEDAADRLYAAHALMEFPSPAVEQALLAAAAGDQDRDVRTTAATSLLSIRGVLSSLFDDSQRGLMMRLDSDDPAEVAAAADTLRELTRP